MKKSSLCILLACFIVIFSLSIAHADHGEKLKIVTTIFPPYDFVREIAGDLVELTMLLPAGTESHSFEPTPRDIIRMQESDLFLYVGGETDKWVDRLLSSMDTDQMTLLPMLDMVQAVPEELVPGMQAEAHEDDEDEHEDEQEEEHELDEHVWTSPKNAILIVQTITDKLCELDPVNADAYRTNAAAYQEKLSALDQAFADVVANAARTTVLFGDRFPFRYLADEYGLTYYAAFPGCATETEASATTIKTLIDTVRIEALPAVFTIEFSNGKIADVICESTGASRLEMHSCHNLSKADFQAGVTYLDLMEKNAAQLKEALN